MIFQGDVRERLRELPDQSVHCVVTSPPYYGLRSYLPHDHPDKGLELGLEATPDEYVANMVAVFREVKRVLRDDGTCWINLGDSYSTHAAGKVENPMKKSTLAGVRTQEVANSSSRMLGRYFKCPSLPEKNLIGIPWRTTFALQSDGWYLRSDIIFSKNNPMPESVTDRPTKSHEYVFLLAKSERYFYDHVAVMETSESGTHNRRTVWSLSSDSFRDAHFATMPRKLVEPCILAGTSEKGCCSECGKPWKRVVDRKASTSARHTRLDCPQSHHAGQTPHRVGGFDDGVLKTINWQPTCACNASIIPCTVLDPFGGSGTTAEVAQRLGRRWIVVELNADYLPFIERRTQQDSLVLTASG